jgi:hypothetical protein
MAARLAFNRPLSFEVKNVTKIEIFTSGSKEQ